MRILPILLLLLAWLPPCAAQAQTRAWLDRDRVEIGETATLNIETDQAGVQAPDWSPLDADFAVSGHTSSRRVEMVGGRTQARVLFAVALQPRRDGLLTVPALRVGSERTQPLTMTVGPASTAPARAGAAAFIEAEADAQEAYVQQAIGYVLRLYYATPLVSGQLEQPQPEGASLQRVGNDLQYSRDIGGRRYTVVERRFLLVPERSGTLTIPGARFEGRGTGGFFDGVLGGGASRTLRATGAPRFLEVEPLPDAAPQPWLPLRGLELRYVEAPQSARVGSAASVVVEVRADGATAVQMPDPQLQVGDGAQVFAEPSEHEEHFDRGRPQVTLTRRFSIVPGRPGALHVSGPSLQWWDVRAGVARTASLPDLALQVEGGSAPGAPAAMSDAVSVGEDSGWVRVPGVQGEVRTWAVATVVFALLWLATLAWALHRRPQASPAPAAPARAAGVAEPERAKLRRLRLALDTGDLGEVADALCALDTPTAADPDALRARLAEPAQVAALEGLERARWAGGDAAAARAGVRAAFAKGARWRRESDVPPATPPLPPLYPE